MNLDNFNKWLTLIANVGVLVGIIFLAIEVQQNSRMMQAQTRDSIAGKLSDYYKDIGSSEYASNLYFQGIRGDLETFAGPESLSFRFLVNSNLRLWENEFYQYKAGLFGEEDFVARSSTWPDVIGFPGFMQEWVRNRRAFEPEFREYVNSLLEEN